MLGQDEQALMAAALHGAAVHAAVAVQGADGDAGRPGAGVHAAVAVPGTDGKGSSQLVLVQEPARPGRCGDPGVDAKVAPVLQDQQQGHAAAVLQGVEDDGSGCNATCNATCCTHSSHAAQHSPPTRGQRTEGHHKAVEVDYIRILGKGVPINLFEGWMA